MRHPLAVGVSDAHLQDAAVAVDVLAEMAGHTVTVGQRPRTDTRSAKLWGVGHCPFGTIGIHPRHDVEGPSLQRPNHLFIASCEPIDQALQHPTGSHRGGQFNRVDRCIDPVSWFGVVRPCRRIRDGRDQQIAPFERLPIRLDRHKIRMSSSYSIEPFDEFLVSQKPVEVVGPVHECSAQNWLVLVGRPNR